MEQEIKKIARHGAYAVIIQDAKILLTQKKSGPYKNLWGLPGGAIEFGESPEFALQREIKEETALAADALELLTVITNCGEYFNNGETYQFHHIGIVYRVNAIEVLPDLIPEEEKRWVKFHEISLDELTPFAKHIWSNKIFWKWNEI